MPDRPFTAHRLPEELAEVRRLLDALATSLAARAAARPRDLLAAAWPAPLATVGEWEGVWEALRNVGGLGPAALTPDERAAHAEALRLVERALRRQMNDDRAQHP
ncbi:MAG TPA: hypothetical protein VFS40_06995 [Gemmatimonadales bacterium]|nr:hypothetical protein [Gemmatimonadales bacterium]